MLNNYVLKWDSPDGGLQRAMSRSAGARRPPLRPKGWVPPPLHPVLSFFLPCLPSPFSVLRKVDRKIQTKCLRRGRSQAAPRRPLPQRVQAGTARGGDRGSTQAGEASGGGGGQPAVRREALQLEGRQGAPPGLSRRRVDRPPRCLNPRRSGSLETSV